MEKRLVSFSIAGQQLHIHHLQKFMRLLFFFLSLSILCIACQPNVDSTNTASERRKDSVSPVPEEAKSADKAAADSVRSKQLLALTSNALQLVDSESGSTREIGFGMPFDQLTGIVSRVLESEPSSVGVNTECGAGPLKMVTWSNGLTLVFAEKKRDDNEWLFAGWFTAKSTSNADIPTTMAGIGVGSTLQDLQNAYAATVATTTLGQEFSVDSGFYGLISGKGKNAVIEVMWSGTSCNFR